MCSIVQLWGYSMKCRQDRPRARQFLDWGCDKMALFPRSRSEGSKILLLVLINSGLELIY